MSEHVDIVKRTKRTESEKKPEIWMERIHGRGKGKTFFKGCVNKVLISSIVLSSVLSTTAPAFAAETTNSYNNYNSYDIIQTYDISVKSAITNLKNTISLVNSMKSKGAVSQSTLESLAKDLYALESSVKSEGDSPSLEAVNTVLDAEKALSGISNADKAWLALEFVKDSFGMGSTATISVTVQQKKAGNTLKSFSDVPTSHPYYTQIMRSVELGLIAGTKAPDANGVGEFNPKGTMTRAQFITVVMRAVAKDELNEYQGSGKYWYSNAAELAVDLGILERMDFDGISNADNMNKAITREEMAHILAKATNYLGLEAVNKVSTNSITDWSKVSPNYQQDVLTTYRMGMITGYGYPGNFGAKDTMTRAQACIVLNRLLDTDNRTQLPTSTTNPQTPSGTKDFDKNDYSTYRGYTIPGQTATAQTWKEGEKHSVPKVGDTIIAKDGTKYTIQATYTQNRCVLGFGIPCDIWTGTVAPDGTVTTVANGTGWWGDDFSSMLRNTATGEVHTSLEWDSLINAGLIKRPTQDGTYDGQVSGYYIWKVIEGVYGTDAGWSLEEESK